MSDKHKVTLYLPPDLHRHLKIKAATSSASMSRIVEQAVSFYLKHSAVVEEVEKQEYGQTYRLHECPECTKPLIFKDGELAALRDQPSVTTEEIATEKVSRKVSPSDNNHSQDQEQLVPC